MHDEPKLFLAVLACVASCGCSACSLSSEHTACSLCTTCVFMAHDTYMLPETPQPRLETDVLGITVFSPTYKGFLPL